MLWREANLDTQKAAFLVDGSGIVCNIGVDASALWRENRGDLQVVYGAACRHVSTVEGRKLPTIYPRLVIMADKGVWRLCERCCFCILSDFVITK